MPALPFRPPPSKGRRAILFALLGAILLASLAGVAYADNYLNRGVAWGDAPAMPYTSLNRMGINTSLQNEVEPTKIKRNLDLIRDAGFKWIRQTFAWNDLEIDGKGDFSDRRNPQRVHSAWDKYDYIVQSAHLREIEVIARLDSTPAWARVGSGQDTAKFLKGPPTNYDDYGDFVYTTVLKYKGQIKYFQLWNEPNLQGEWGGLKINPADFTRLLRIGYQRAKQANPDCVIVMPGLAPTDGLDYPINMNDMKFLQGMYDAGAKPYFDIASVMIYGFDDPPDSHRLEYRRVNFVRPILSREVMLRNGDERKPVWASEYAWLALDPTLDSQHTWPPSPQYSGKKTMWLDGVSEQQQADYLVAGFERARREWPWMGVMCVWKLRDPDAPPTEPATWFGIVRPDFSPRPAYFALQTYAANGGNGTLAGSGYHTAADPAIDYGGGWRREPNGNMIGDPAAEATISTLIDEFALDASPAAGLSMERKLLNNRQTITLKVGSAELRLRGFSLARQQPMLARVGWTAAYLVAAGGLAVSGYGLLPWLLWLLDSLGVLLLALLRLLLAGLRRRPGSQRSEQGASGMFKRMIYTLTHLLLPPGSLNPAVAAHHGGSPTGWGQRLASSELAAGIGLAASIALFYLPNTRAEYLSDINPWGLIFGALGIFCFGLARPALLLAAVVALIPLYNNANIATYTKFIGKYSFPIAEILLLIAVLVVGLRGLAKLAFARFAPRGWQAVDAKATTIIPAIRTPFARLLLYLRADAFALFALAWLAVGVLSTIVVANPTYRGDSLRELRWTVIEPVVFYFLYIYVVRSQRTILRVFDGLVLAAAAISLYGIYQLAFDVRTVAAGDLSRVVSVYLHPNNLALYLGRVLPLAAALALYLPRLQQTRRILYAIACLPILAAITFTFSRGGWLGVAGALLLVAVLGWRFVFRGKIARRTLLGVGGGLALLAGGGLLFALLRLRDLSSIGLRVYIWEGAIKMLRDHPIFGVGLDQFYHQYLDKYIDRSNPQAVAEQFTSHPHNLVLDYWLRLGIIGLLIASWLVVSFYRFGFWLLRLTRDAGSRAVLIAILAGMTDFLLHGLIDQAYFIPDLALIFWLLCAAMEATRRLVVNEE